VLSTAKIGCASWRYYQNQVARGLEYYTRGECEAPGVWYGRGLGPLGLQGDRRVGEAQLEAMFARALHPVTGAPLGRGWRADGVTGFDLCFSAPKSVSVLWALGDEPVQARVWGAHSAAVRAGLDYLDVHAAFARRGRDGVEQMGTAGLAAACFDHRTSRAGDPQIHTHALVVNKARCPDGGWRSLDGHELYHHKKSAGMLYQAALRAELASRLGVAFTEPNEHGQAEIAGVPAQLMKAWSKRTGQVVAEAAPKIAEYERALGRPLSSAERVPVTKIAVLKTRPAKTLEAADTLHGRWADEAARLGWTGRRLATAVQEAVRRRMGADPGDSRLIEQAVVASGRRRAAFSRADLAAEIAACLPGTSATAGDTRARVELLTALAVGHADVVGLGELRNGFTARASDHRYATQELLAAERRVLALAEAGRQAMRAAVPSTLASLLVGGGLDDDQLRAVERLTTSGAFLEVLAAPAGAGKTTVLGAVARVWRAASVTVLGLAPTARAAAELAAATGGPAETLAKWAHEQSAGPSWLSGRTVVLVDEASRADTFTVDRLTRAAEQTGAKVVLVGDPHQPGVIDGPGGLLGALADAGHAVALTGVRRFAEVWERTASLALRAGDPEAIACYAARGRVHPAGGREQALDAVYTHWAQVTATGRAALMLAHRRADTDALNARARAAALTAGRITGTPVRFGSKDWQPGDLLLARRNHRGIPLGTAHLRNGDRFSVASVSETGLVVTDLAGRGRTLLPAEYVTRHGDYGWASTIATTQGATTDVGILLAHPGLDREHLYVGLTRGRQANHVHVNPTPSDAETHHLPGTGPTSLADAVGVLRRVQARVGAEPAAHTAARRSRPGPNIDELSAQIRELRRGIEQATRRLSAPRAPARLPSASPGRPWAEPYRGHTYNRDTGVGFGR
jgi:conjugative relaxase-like TrwC/TraI family protein